MFDEEAIRRAQSRARWAPSDRLEQRLRVIADLRRPPSSSQLAELVAIRRELDYRSRRARRRLRLLYWWRPRPARVEPGLR